VAEWDEGCMGCVCMVQLMMMTNAMKEQQSTGAGMFVFFFFLSCM
jgi:hypothetical protein